MMKDWVCFLTLGIIYISTTSGCDEVNQCFSSNMMKEIQKAMTRPTGTIFAAKLTGTIFTASDVQQFCRKWKESLEGCMERNLPMCKEAERIAYQGLHDALQYMCTDGYEGYLKHANCYEQDSVTLGLNQCTDEFEQKVSDLAVKARNGDISQEEYKSRACVTINEFLDCISTKVESICGQEAAVIFRTVYEKEFAPTKNFLGCSPMASGCTSVDQCFYSNEMKIILKAKARPIGRVFTVRSTDTMWTASQIQQFCRKWESVDCCMVKKLPSCEEAQRTAGQGLHDMLQYVCTDGYQGYLKYANCYNRNDVNSGLSKCEGDFEQKVSALSGQAKYDEISQEEFKNQACSIINQLLDCMATRVGSSCGQEAAAILRTAFDKELTPAKNFLGCGALNRWVMIAIIIVVLVTLLMAAVGAGAYLTHRYQKKKTTSPPYTNFNNEQTSQPI